jgi:hypothetical protein
MKELFTLVFAMCFSVTGFAQVTISGTIQHNSIPVAYATIGIKGTNRSVMSNENGEFKLEVKSLPQVIMISAIGFQMQEYNLVSEHVSILLTTKVYAIKEVTVFGDAAFRIFDKAYKRLMKPNYRAFNGKVFYRLITQNDTTYTELMEGFYDVQAGPTGFNYWKLTHGRYAIVDDYKQQHYVKSVDFSALVKFVNIINDHERGVNFPDFPFQPNARASYDFRLNGYTWLNNKEVSKVQFLPKKSSKDLFGGTAYIDEVTGNLHRLEVNYSKSPSNLVRTQVDGNPVKNLTIQYTIDFTESAAGSMLISWVNADLKYTYE